MTTEKITQAKIDNGHAGLGTVFLQPRDAAYLAICHGFTDFYDIATLVAVGLAESLLGVNAWHDNLRLITEIPTSTWARNQETGQLFRVLDPATGKVRLDSDGSVETYPLTVTPVVSRDVGWLQISIGAEHIGQARETELHNPDSNVEAAHRLFTTLVHGKPRRFQPWAAYNSGVYLHSHYAPLAALGVMNRVVEHFNDAGAKIPSPLFTEKELRAKL